ncbi:MAG: SoxR reducing system RseC family protein [Deltaproteobacteria bacterium]|nr:SoxR reducing system RseC family protein [Deltaproteobacteria bacterium]MBW2481425.1 SoxR reducing system RseC family protein [Deltaproteobacteria bacterium]
MATEQGIVIKADSRAAWVKTVKTGDCAGCTARGSCHSMGNSGEKEVKAINEAGAREGDRILLLFETSSLLKATFLLYVFPILLLIIGAVLGQEMAPRLNFNPSGLSALTGFFFFFAAVLIVKTRANKMARKKEYRPKVVKILARASRLDHGADAHKRGG